MGPSPPEKDTISKSYSHSYFYVILEGSKWGELVHWSKIKLVGLTTKCSKVYAFKNDVPKTLQGSSIKLINEV